MTIDENTTKNGASEENPKSVICDITHHIPEALPRTPALAQTDVHATTDEHLVVTDVAIHTPTRKYPASTPQVETINPDVETRLALFENSLPKIMTKESVEKDIEDWYTNRMNEIFRRNRRTYI